MLVQPPELGRPVERNQNESCRIEMHHEGVKSKPGV